MKLILPIFFILTAPLAFSADRFVLLKNKSTVKYQVTKFRGLPNQAKIIGELTLDAKSSMKGSVSIADELSLNEIKGSVTIVDPEFDSKNSGRDEEVINMMSKDSDHSITVELNSNDYNFDANSGVLKSKINLKINGITRKVSMASKIKFKDASGKKIAIVAGKMIINRQHFDVTATGFAAIADGLIDDKFLLTFKLIFLKK